MSTIGFVLVEPITERVATALQQYVAKLSELRDWSRSPPEFVDETDSAGATRPEDAPVRTLGGGRDFEKKHEGGDSERRAFQDTEALVNELGVFSSEYSCSFEFYLDNTYAGSLTNGRPSKGLAVGLLAEWARSTTHS